jgi:hypothetical protein
MAPKESPVQGMPHGVGEPSDFTVYEEIADVLGADEPVFNTSAAPFGAMPTANAPGPAPMFGLIDDCVPSGSTRNTLIRFVGFIDH